MAVGIRGSSTSHGSQLVVFTRPYVVVACERCGGSGEPFCISGQSTHVEKADIHVRLLPEYMTSARCYSSAWTRSNGKTMRTHIELSWGLAYLRFYPGRALYGVVRAPQPVVP